MFKHLRPNADQQDFLLLLENSESLSRHCLTSAFQHLDEGISLRDSHPNLARLSAITAEEEAATAVLRLLKEKKYPGSDKLSAWSHPHKHAVFPFVKATQKLVCELESHGYEIRLRGKDRDGAPRMSTVLLNMLELDGEPQAAFPDPPLNVRISVDGKFVDLRPRIAESLGSIDEAAIYREIATIANERNLLLYANENGPAPRIPASLDYFREKGRRVMYLLVAYLLIEPHAEQSPLVQSVVDEFVRIMEKGSRKGKACTPAITSAALGAS